MASHDKHRIICSRVAQLLRELREAKKLSMNQVAERSGLSQQMVSYVERGMRNPTLETLLRMTAALDADLSSVIQKASKAVTKRAGK